MITRIACTSRSIAIRTAAPTLRRQFHGSPIAHETVTEKAKELGRKVNIKVGQGLASAIDTGEKAAHATKEKLESAQNTVEEGKDFVEKKADDAVKGAQKAKKDLERESANISKQRVAGHELAARTLQRYTSTKAFGCSIVRRYSVKVDYESKYAERMQELAAEKGLSAEQLKEQAKQAQNEESRRRREEREAALAAERKKQETSSDTPTSTRPLNTSRKDSSPVKPLSSILNTSLVLSTPHTSEQISQLWNAYHMSRSGGTGRGFLCASIPLDLYKKMLAVAEKYPTFIVPIRRPRDTSTPPAVGERDSAYEFYFLQWDFHDVPVVPSANGNPIAKPSSSESPNPKISTVLFTSLEEYKLHATFATPYIVLTNYTDLASTRGLVLLRGEITPRNGASGNYMLSQEDAQQLSMAIQKFYLWGNGESEGGKLLRTFHEKPEEFKWEDLLKVADWEI
ncbi:Protein ATP11, mitochondrial [Leucoagaricus sp. SymC.cos]|nr:Protein ATP11, mitochondrial [Leucoagaricus sp. SymC.cos]